MGQLIGRALLAAGLLATLTACAAAPAATPTTAAPAAATTAPSIDTSAAGALAANAELLASRPKPTDAQVRDLGVQLAAIQPELAEVPADRLGRWIDAMCGAIWTQSINHSDLVAGAQGRFEGGNRPPLTDQQAQQIVDAISATYCHTA